jgi:hypothetical protein
MQDVIAFGAEHSSFDDLIKKAAARNVIESPDPPARRGRLHSQRSQYSFVRQGIPSTMPSPGFKSNDPKIEPMAIFEKWEQVRYHQPQDGLDQQGLDFEAAAKFAPFVFLCGYMVSQDKPRPTWNKGDFSGDHYGKLAK